MPNYAADIHPSGRITITLDRDLDQRIQAAHMPGEPMRLTLNRLLRLGLESWENRNVVAHSTKVVAEPNIT